MFQAELESLRRGLESGEEEGTQAVLNTKIQQLEAQIENMQVRPCLNTTLSEYDLVAI